MKLFLSKIFLFCLLILGLGIILWAKSPSAILDSPDVISKLNYLKKNNHYNTIFVGSSKVNNHINPAIIDSLNPGLKTYNLGANASFNLENFNTIHRLLEDNNLKLKILVLELQDKIEFSRSNINSQRSFSSLTPKNLVFALKFHYENRDYKQIAFTVYSALLNFMSFNKNEQSRKIIGSEDYINHNGFIPLEKDGNQEVKKRHEKLLKDPEEINRRLKLYHNDQNHYKTNSALVEELLLIKEKCKRKGISFIILFSAPAEPTAKKLLPYEKTNLLSVINMVEPSEHPEFYVLENRWDYGHLNEKGANILSLKIALEIRKLH